MDDLHPSDFREMRSKSKGDFDIAYSATDGEQPDRLLLGKGFPRGTRWLRKGWDLLWLLTILETMTKNNKVGSDRTTVRGFIVPRPKRLRRRPFPAFPELRVGLGLVTADGLPGIPGLLDSSLLARTRGGESQRNANCVDLSSRRELVGTVDAFLSAKPVAPGTGPSVDGTTPCTERLLEYRWSDHGVFLVSCRLSSCPKEDTRGTQCGRFVNTGRRPLTKPRPWLLR
ncbi:unnamed protein product [Pocillopora meandrina]|uniref:Uncharacterized protein n=1 Tax=Pocillopora meandrina TaxID=46732 RepID=A0AAU9XR76_9CNID|nr:unnamed protein product [Pocillopora meandrina]